MDKNQNKEAYEDAIGRTEEVKENIKTIGTRSAWLLGLLIVIIIALASFLFRSYNLPFPEQNTNELFILIRTAATILLLFYIASTLFYMWRLIVPKFGKLTHETRDIQELEKNIETNTDIQNKLIHNFRTLIFSITISIPTAFIVASAFLRLFVSP